MIVFFATHLANLLEHLPTLGIVSFLLRRLCLGDNDLSQKRCCSFIHRKRFRVCACSANCWASQRLQALFAQRWVVLGLKVILEAAALAEEQIVSSLVARGGLLTVRVNLDLPSVIDLLQGRWPHQLRGIGGFVH